MSHWYFATVFPTTSCSNLKYEVHERDRRHQKRKRICRYLTALSASLMANNRAEIANKNAPTHHMMSRHPIKARHLGPISNTFRMQDEEINHYIRCCIPYNQGLHQLKRSMLPFDDTEAPQWRQSFVPCPPSVGLLLCTKKGSHGEMGLHEGETNTTPTAY